MLLSPAVLMLSEEEAQGLESWLYAAQGWAESAQAMVGAASRLATTSRDVGDILDGAPGALGDGTDHAALAGELRELATKVEGDTVELRNRFLSTAADLDGYRSALR